MDLTSTGDPDRQALTDRLFSKLKEHRVWRHPFETLDEAWEVIAEIDRYHHRPHSWLNYRTGRGRRNLGDALGDLQTQGPAASTAAEQPVG